MSFKVRVKNIGTLANSAANNIVINFYLDGNTIPIASKTNFKVSLAPGTSSSLLTANVGQWVATTGTHTITATVDTTNVIDESNEGNNTSLPITKNVSGVAVDTTPPVVTNVSASSITSSGATISWNTDDLASGQVHYGTSSNSYGNDSSLIPALSQLHSISLSSLLPNQTYYFVVESKNGANLYNTSPIEYSFTTLSTVTNNPPLVNAGHDITVSGGALNNIEIGSPFFASVSDPDGDPMILQWSKVSGPGDVTFQNPNILTTYASFSQAGNYTLRLTATDSKGATASDEIVVSI